MQRGHYQFTALVFFLSLYNFRKGDGMLFAVPGEDVFFNISITNAHLDSSFIALEKSQDERHKLMVFLDRINPPDIAGAYRGRIKYTGNIGRGEMTFFLYNVSMADAGEFRVVPVGIRKVLGSQLLAVAGRPDHPIIVERTIPQVNKDHVLECKTHSNSRPEKNGFKMSFIWNLNDTKLENNSNYTVEGHILRIHNLHRGARFDNYTCVAYDSPKLRSNASDYYQMDPKYGPAEELTLDPSNRTYFVEAGFEMRNITCSADCHPDCIYTWDRGVRQGAKLLLGVVDGDKAGIYKCTARNPITNISLSTSFEVILVMGNNCSCLRGTCGVELCSSSRFTSATTAESRQISSTHEYRNNRHDDFLECPVATETIGFTGGSTHSVSVLMDCSLLPNEFVLGVAWFKENKSIAEASKSTFTPCGSYIGRLERFGTFQISLHNLSVNDSGHYQISVLLKYRLTDTSSADAACQTTYLPVLPEELWGYHAWKDQMSVKDEDSSPRDKQGLTQLEIGLMCGFGLVTVLGLGVILWCFYRKICKTSQRESKSTSPEQMQMLSIL